MAAKNLIMKPMTTPQLARQLPGHNSAAVCGSTCAFARIKGSVAYLRYFTYLVPEASSSLTSLQT